MPRSSISMKAPDLHVHSTFSILDGMGNPAAIAQRAKELGWAAVALTDHGWLGGAPVFYKACKEIGIKPIIGCELYVVPDVEVKQRGQKNFHLTTLALSKEGYENLVTWSSWASRRENYHYRPRITPEKMTEIAPHPLHHNVILSGCLAGELCQSLLNENGAGPRIDVAAEYVRAMRTLFPNFYIEIQHHHMPKLMDKGWENWEQLCLTEKRLQKSLMEVAAATDTPLVLTNDSHFQESEQRFTHLNMLASNMRNRDDAHYGLSGERLAAAYMKHYAYTTSYMRDMERIAELGNLPEECLESAIEIANETNIVLDPLDTFSYAIPFSGYDKPLKEIRRRTRERLDELVEIHGDVALDRFEHELSAMGSFAHYLILMSEFLTYAKRQGILTNTRGSAANSLVCYCLNIHDIDPIHYGLVFERFYNPSRKKLPDIDIDIEADRFQDFMEYVKSRMEILEGEGQVVQICNYGTLANRAAFRLVAEAQGISKEQQDEISKLLPQMIDSGMVEEKEEAYALLKEEHPEIYELVAGVFDSIKNVSQHACGWLFGAPSQGRPIEQWVPLCLIASSGTLVTQYNMDSLDDFGMVKGDFLRLKTLSVIKRTLKLVNKDTNDLEQIPLDDEKTFAMLREGKTEGIFTLQGKTNRAGCMECEVSNEHDVIASVAIYRPALTRPGYHHVYNRRRRGEEEPEYPCKLAEEVLGSSYGLPIFQEQILELGYGLGMSHREVEEFLQAIKKAKGLGRGAKEAFEKIRPMYHEYASKMLTEEEEIGLWTLIENFQGYGFNKGHATSYGRLAVRAAFLKAHYPRHFYSALLDVYPDKLRYVASARGDGFKFVGPSVNDSQMGFSLGAGRNEIRVGLSRIKGLGPVAVRAIIDSQPFTSLADFKERIPARSCNKTAISALIATGAFDCLGVEGEHTDLTEFQYLGFTLNQPEVFDGCKPKYVRKWESESGHKFLGLQHGVDMSEGRTSVAKLFWIPPMEKLIERKASAWAQVKSTLLTAVDENGIPFHILAGEDRKEEASCLNFLADYCKGAVVCITGRVKQPYLQDGPLSFQFYNFAGGREHDPQIWHVPKKKYLAAKHYTYQFGYGKLKREAA